MRLAERNHAAGAVADGGWLKITGADALEQVGGELLDRNLGFGEEQGVDPCGERQVGDGERIIGGESVHAEIVGDDEAVEAQVVAEHAHSLWRK